MHRNIHNRDVFEAVNFSHSEAGITETPEPAETVPKEDEPVETEPQKNSSGITILLVFLLLGGGAGAYYYLKFVKGKKEDFKLEDDLDFYDDEDYVNEDETPITFAMDCATLGFSATTSLICPYPPFS